LPQLKKAKRRRGKMSRGEAEDAGGRLPVKDDNEAAVYFNRRTLLFSTTVTIYAGGRP